MAAYLNKAHTNPLCHQMASMLTSSTPTIPNKKKVGSFTLYFITVIRRKFQGIQIIAFVANIFLDMHFPNLVA